ncbi:MAG TPA: multicopper oxidase domain-containing protein [Vicinamibacterales bacterium]|nr:multicopper oxidase domain-containing protein [Vicinamibacterales bacterium]
MKSLATILVCLAATLFGPTTGGSAQSTGQKAAPAKVRTYYLAADEVTWDYAPGNKDGITGEPVNAIGFFKGSKPEERVPKPVSTKYLKTVYREYTDGTFKALKPRAPEWDHLGFLGPVIHAEVGDTIKVIFRNNGDHPYSVHPHGVFYKKDSEGAPYQDGTSGKDKADDGVPPGGTHTYTWEVPERTGPGPMDPSSVMWMYHSHVDEVKDPNTGLMGAMIVTGRGKAKPDGSPKDVDRELVVMFSQIHEEDSWYFLKNVKMADNPVPPPPGLSQNFYPFFVTFSINGFAHGTMPLDAMTVRKGERVRWYAMSSTNDFDFHTPHWHGNVVTANHMRTDVAFMGPMQMVTADMVPDNEGTWLLHCHVSFHNTAGMTGRYAVAPAAAKRKSTN